MGAIRRVGDAALRITQPTLGHFPVRADGHPRAVVHQQREQRRTAMEHAERDHARQGRVPSPRRRRRGCRGRSHRHRHQGGRVVRARRCPAGAQRELRMRLAADAVATSTPFTDFGKIFAERRQAEADHYHRTVRQRPPATDVERRDRAPSRREHGVVAHVLSLHRRALAEDGDPAQPAPPPRRASAVATGTGGTLWARDVIAIPDGLEYPWFLLAWDLGFPRGRDGAVRSELREATAAAADARVVTCTRTASCRRTSSPRLGDRQPVRTNAWAVWRVYQLRGRSGSRLRPRIPRAGVRPRCLIRFRRGGLNREDAEGDNLFAGGFLGLDNIGVFDRSRRCRAAAS